MAANYDYPLIKIYTNQDVYGLGEVRDAGVEGIALILKAHLVGRNPLNIEGNLRMMRKFANHGRMGGGYSAVDMALHDIAGKVYGVPAYRLIGNKNHDRIRIYADTTSHPDPKVYAERMRKRKEMGLTFFKMDLQSSTWRAKTARRAQRTRRLHRKGLGLPLRIHRRHPRCHRPRHAAGRRPFRPAQCQRFHPLRQGVRTLPAFLGRGPAADRRSAISIRT